MTRIVSHVLWWKSLAAMGARFVFGLTCGDCGFDQSFISHKSGGEPAHVSKECVGPLHVRKMPHALSLVSSLKAADTPRASPCFR